MPIYLIKGKMLIGFASLHFAFDVNWHIRQAIINKSYLYLDISEFMKIGDRVRVKTSLNVFHHPEHKGKAFDIAGLEGEIIRVHTEWKGRPISPNYPYEVRFTPKFVSHLGDHEIEPVS